MRRVNINRMKRKILLILTAFLILGSLLIISCSTFKLPQEQGVILFQDNFSSPNSGWVRYHDDKYSSDYVGGAYRIKVNQRNFEAWSVPRLDFSDVLIDVTVRKIGGPNNNVFGIICRYREPNNFYFFLISSDGYAGIGIYQDGERTLLTGETMLPSDSINIGEEANKIQIECVGEVLSLTINDVEIYQVKSSEFRSGDVGVIAGSYNSPGVEIEFDEFFVRNP